MFPRLVYLPASSLVPIDPVKESVDRVKAPVGGPVKPIEAAVDPVDSEPATVKAAPFDLV